MLNIIIDLLGNRSPRLYHGHTTQMGPSLAAPAESLQCQAKTNIRYHTLQYAVMQETCTTCLLDAVLDL